MDDTPKAFIEEFRSAILKKRVGQIAIAVVLAEAVWRLLTAFNWYLIMPIIGRFVEGQTESVLFSRASGRPILWENLFGSILEFLLTVIVVFYANRWIHKKPHSIEENVEVEYSLVGEPFDRRDEPAASQPNL
jgi:large-conductance mechanosensitive channel